MHPLARHGGIVAEGNCRRMKSKRCVTYIRVFSARVRVIQRRVCTGNIVEDEFASARARMCMCVYVCVWRARVCDTIPRSWHVFIRQASIVSSYSKVKDRNWSVKADVIVSLFFRRAHASAYARVHIAHTWGASILPCTVVYIIGAPSYQFRAI